MPPFKAVIFRTTRDYKIPVTTLYDVERAMGMSWPNKSSDSYRSAACILEQAKLGWCSPRAAFDAFVFAAQETCPSDKADFGKRSYVLNQNLGGRTSWPLRGRLVENCSRSG